MLQKKCPPKNSSYQFGRHYFQAKHVGRHLAHTFMELFSEMAMVIEDFVRILWDFARIPRGAIALLNPASFTSVSRGHC